MWNVSIIAVILVNIAWEIIVISSRNAVISKENAEKAVNLE